MVVSDSSLRGVSSAGELLPYKQAVVGSNPSPPKNQGCPQGTLFYFSKVEVTVMDNFLIRLEKILYEIEEAKSKANRKDHIKLMAITKTHPKEVIEKAYDAGQFLFGENRVQEIEEKFPLSKSGYQLHMVGHLQSNKVKKIIALVDSIDSIDSVKVLKLINREALQNDLVMPVLFQYKISDEALKGGFTTEIEYYKALEIASDLKGVSVKGVMGIAPFSSNEKIVRNSFSILRELRDQSKIRFPNLDFQTLSMGMSLDFKWAIEEGSTLVRIGSSLFGEREK